VFEEPSLSHLVRALLAIGLAIMLPVVLYFGPSAGVHISGAMQTYLDVLTAVVAFYFGHTSDAT
jgi:hypothetical protein